MTKDESDALALVRVFMTDDRFNAPAIFRHATAPVLEAEFKSGRQQFAVQRGMSVEAVALANERVRILDVAFGEAGLNRRQIIGAQLPALRQFMDAGVWPGGKAASVLDGLPEGMEVLSRRALSGHLNPNELNPTVSAYKHINNLLMREHFDDVAKAAGTEIQLMQDAKKEFTARVMADYLHEIEGGTSRQFRAITRGIRSMGRGMGIQVDDRLAERITATLGKFAYQASIPFRPALIMRNYLQTMFFTAPVVGPRSWLHGLEFTTNPKTMRESFNLARKAGAIDANTIPLFGADEIFGVEAARFGDRFGPIAKRAAFKTEELFNMGFSVYRSADDWGRAVAFHAGRNRVNRNVKAFNQTQDLEAFKVASKVKTFDETIEQEFENLVLAGRFTDAENFIGKQLADKTHLLYGNANRPAGWGGVGGRLFGQFGTFPVQYADYVVESLTRGTVKDRTEWAAVHGAINAGVIVAGAEVFGADLTSWATIPSVRYTGGPYMDAAMSLFQVVGGSEAERSLAQRNLKMMFPTMEHPSSIFIPGSYFVGDMVDAFAETDPRRIFGEAAGLRFLKAGEKNSVEKLFGFMF